MKTSITAIPILSVVAAVIALCGWDYLRPVRIGAPQPIIDLIIVDKSAHRMTLLHQGRVQRSYLVALGRGGRGAKMFAGDNKVPEGSYHITGRNPRSAFHLALRIGYPTNDQVQAARRRGLDPGGDMMIHGIHNGFGWIAGLHRRLDWTRGCIAVTDSEIEEIWSIVTDGTRIKIRP